jgi:hypothetical protein
MSRWRGTGVLLAVVALVALGGGCGRDDFKNDPRPPVPLEATVEITDTKVQVSPESFGAGLVNFTIANNSSADAVFALTGKTDATSEPIPANGNTTFKVPMQTGTYEAGVYRKDSIKKAQIEVGSERASAQNDLLLP